MITFTEFCNLGYSKQQDYILEYSNDKEAYKLIGELYQRSIYNDDDFNNLSCNSRTFLLEIVGEDE